MVVSEVTQIEGKVEAYVHRPLPDDSELDDLILVSSRLRPQALRCAEGPRIGGEHVLGHP